MRKVNLDDPRVQAMRRVPMPAERKARRARAVGVCIACLAAAVLGWFIPGMPFAVTLLVFDTLFWIGAVGLLWMFIAWVWWWLRG